MIRRNNWIRTLLVKLGILAGGGKRPLTRARLNIELLEVRDVPSGTPPTAVADFYAVHQGKMLTVQPLVNDTDLEDTTLIPTITTNGAKGYGYFDGAGNLHYTAYAGNVGIDTLSYRVSDGMSDSGIVDISIDITNTPPDAVADEYSVHQGKSISVTPLTNDSDADPEGDNLTLSITANATKGYAYFDSANILHYMAYAGNVGDDFVTYRIYDGAEYSDEVIATFHITNTPPVAVDDEYSVHQGGAISVTPLTNDSDTDLEGDNLTLSITANATKGYAFFDSANNLYYPAYAGQVGDDFVTYRIYDGAEYSDEVISTFHITNIAPIAINDTYLTFENQTTTVSPLKNDHDPNNDTLTPGIVTHAANGYAYFDGTNNLVYAPNTDFVGKDTVTYRIWDGAAYSDPRTVTFHVLSSSAAVNGVAFHNLGTGSALLSWDDFATSTLIGPNESIALPTNVLSARIRLLESDKSYEFFTNGDVGNVDYAPNVTSVDLRIDTSSLPLYGTTVTGSIGDILLPPGTTNSKTILNVVASGDINSMTGAANATATIEAGEISCRNLVDSITGINKIETLIASDWLGGSSGSSIQVAHGVGRIEAYGIKGTAVLNSEYDTLDIDTTILIGDGGIETKLDVENVTFFTCSGDIGTISIGTLKGDFTLDGTVAVDTFVLAAAQDNAGIQASQATFRLFRTPAFGLDEHNVRFNGYRWIFARDVNIGTIQVFQAGIFPVNSFTQPPNVDTYYRLDFRQNLTIGYCEIFDVWGSLKVAGNISLGAAYSIKVSGISVSQHVGPEDTTNAIEVGNRFDIGRFINDSTTLTQPSFASYRSVVIPRFRAVQGSVTSFFVGAPAWPGAGDFTGSIRFDDGNVEELKIKGALKPHNPLPTDLVYINGELDLFECKGIGTNSWGLHPRIFANSIGEIRSGSSAGPIPVSGAIAANIQVARSIGTITVVGNITGDVTAAAGDIELIDVAAMTGNIFVTGGDLRRLRAATLQGSIDVQRDRTARNANIGGNIWRLNVTGNISSALIHADNSIAEITAGTVSNSVRIILQVPGAIVLVDDVETIQVTGGALSITLTSGEFRPFIVLFTHYLVSLSDYTFPSDDSAANSWKIPLRYYYRILSISDRIANSNRAVLWTVLTDDFNGTAIPVGVAFTYSAQQQRMIPTSTLVEGTPIFIDDNPD